MARFVVNGARVLDVVDLKSAQPAEGLSLSRWSRLKRSGGEAEVAPASEVLAVPEAVGETAMPLSAAEVANGADLNLPEMSSISLAEDFTPFMQAKVPQALRQQALKALFKEPHFNVMDGLDTYIDDYTVFEPIPPEVMSTLSSWKTIMNPLEQVVTPGGYAVDVESEEGKAVLAARRESDALAQEMRVSEGQQASNLVSEQDASPLPVADEGCADEAGEQAKPEVVRSNVPPIQHLRHNKRVGDFAYIDAAKLPPSGAEITE